MSEELRTIGGSIARLTDALLADYETILADEIQLRKVRLAQANN